MKRLLAFSIVLFCTHINFGQKVWTIQQANDWYAKQPLLIGCNYIPYNAINELEMWQAETFDPVRIDQELGWAESIGMNTLRVFLHDLLWQDAEGFKKRLEQFLVICEKHHIRPLFVLFDSVWDPNPKLGKQRDPKPGIHNSGWVQSPGLAALQDEKQHPRLEAYVKGVVGAFANDARVLGWDIWNEPDNLNGSSYTEPQTKLEWVRVLLPKAFAWVRAAGATQPLTSGVWKIDYANYKGLSPIERIQVNESDIISFHSYEKAPDFERSFSFLQQYKRPVICTEYLARGNKSTFEMILPIAKDKKIGMFNWGFVAGKTQPNLPWDSWQNPYINGRNPAVWHHEIFYPDGRPYKQEEVDFIRKITGVKLK